jgi:hypothetical protein
MGTEAGAGALSSRTPMLNTASGGAGVEVGRTASLSGDRRPQPARSAEPDSRNGLKDCQEQSFLRWGHLLSPSPKKSRMTTSNSRIVRSSHREPPSRELSVSSVALRRRFTCNIYVPYGAMHQPDPGAASLEQDGCLPAFEVDRTLMTGVP